MNEIVLPETEPALEWIRGRAVQKVSPKRRHARLQLLFGRLLDDWARGRGEVGTEWRFRLAPPGEVRRPLVPDVAYVSFARLAGLAGDDLEAPPVAPEIVVEILSPGDRPDDVAAKREVYLATGVELLLIVDPERRTMDVHDDQGHETVGAMTYRTRPFPDLEIPLDAFFAELDRVPHRRS